MTGINPLKTKKAMKKTIKFFSMAALVMLGAMTVNCSSNNDIIDEEPVKKDNIVTMTISAGMDEGAETRALGYDNTSHYINTNFAAGETMAVLYTNESGQTVKAITEPLTEGDITSTNKLHATFTVTLVNPKASAPVRYIYPSAMAAETVDPSAAINNDANINYAALENQDGSITTIGQKYALAIYDGSTTSDKKLPNSYVNLRNQFALARIHVRNNSNTDVTTQIKSLTISDGTNSYSVVPASTPSDGIFVVLRPFSSKTLHFVANDASTCYVWSTSSSMTLEKNQAKDNTWIKLPATGISNSQIDNTSTAESSRKNVYLQSNGNFSTTKDGNSKAVVVYVGCVPGYFNHFLALALTNASGTYYYSDGTSTYPAAGAVSTYAASNGITMLGKTYNTNAIGTDFYDIFRYDSSNPRTATASTTTPAVQGWRLTSVTDWRYVIQAMTSTRKSATDPTTVKSDNIYSNENGKDRINYACGNTDIVSGSGDISYWTCSKEYTSGAGYEYIWAYSFNDNGYFRDYQNEISRKCCVRAVFAY